MHTRNLLMWPLFGGKPPDKALTSLPEAGSPPKKQMQQRSGPSDETPMSDRKRRENMQRLRSRGAEGTGSSRRQQKQVVSPATLPSHSGASSSPPVVVASPLKVEVPEDRAQVERLNELVEREGMLAELLTVNDSQKLGALAKLEADLGRAGNAAKDEADELARLGAGEMRYELELARSRIALQGVRTLGGNKMAMMSSESASALSAETAHEGQSEEAACLSAINIAMQRAASHPGSSLGAAHGMGCLCGSPDTSTRASSRMASPVRAGGSPPPGFSMGPSTPGPSTPPRLARSLEDEFEFDSPDIAFVQGGKAGKSAASWTWNALFELIDPKQAKLQARLVQEAKANAEAARKQTAALAEQQKMDTPKLREPASPFITKPRRRKDGQPPQSPTSQRESPPSQPSQRESPPLQRVSAPSQRLSPPTHLLSPPSPPSLLLSSPSQRLSPPSQRLSIPSQRTPQPSHRSSPLDSQRLLPPQLSQRRSPPRRGLPPEVIHAAVWGVEPKASPPKSPPKTPAAQSTRRESRASREAVSRYMDSKPPAASSEGGRVTSSPSGKQHANPVRRKDIRGADMVSNIDFISAKPGSTENECKVKEASWVPSQAWFESLRYYPSRDEAIMNDESYNTYSGNTHGARKPAHIEMNVRTRLGLAPADPEWTPAQLPHVWSPDAGVVVEPRPMHVARTPPPPPSRARDASPWRQAAKEERQRKAGTSPSRTAWRALA